MTSPTPDFSAADQAFARYRAHGDPNDLATVFDRVASRLLLVAAHISPDPAAAEDLVQETFVHALESVQSFEPGRPVLPWLTTILRRRAIDRMRRDDVLKGPSIDEVILAAKDSSPADTASEGEVLEQVERALEKMESPYRDCLVLRIVHGLSPTEIAHALNRKPGTVRMQLKRGLEELRTKLPIGIASVLVLAILPERGLAAVRAKVLDTAGGGKMLAAYFGLPRGTWLALVGVIVGLITVPFAWSSFVDGGEANPPPTEPGASVAAIPESSGNADDKGGLNDLARLSAPTNDQSTSMSGRCLSVETSAPIAGAEIEVSFSAGRFVQDDAQAWPDSIFARSKADGRFEVVFEPGREMRIRLTASAAGYASTSADWVSLRNG
ncbi:MAG: sigma-70 family RNA polymerase sigma factor, partial [bacterium]|nr:sigma-70 family RNA polymerase sigma factor [bacterium]